MRDVDRECDPHRDEKMNQRNQWTMDRQDFAALAELRERLAEVEGGELTPAVWERSHRLREHIRELCRRLKIGDRLPPAPARSEVSHYVPVHARLPGASRTSLLHQRRRAAGLCVLCGQRAQARLCEQHRESERTRRIRLKGSQRTYACSACGERGHSRATCRLAAKSRGE